MITDAPKPDLECDGSSAAATDGAAPSAPDAPAPCCSSDLIPPLVHLFLRQEYSRIDPGERDSCVVASHLPCTHQPVTQGKSLQDRLRAAQRHAAPLRRAAAHA